MWKNGNGINNSWNKQKTNIKTGDSNPITSTEALKVNGSSLMADCQIGKEQVPTIRCLKETLIKFLKVMCQLSLIKSLINMKIFSCWDLKLSTCRIEQQYHGKKGTFFNRMIKILNSPNYQTLSSSEGTYITSLYAQSSSKDLIKRVLIK